MRLIHRIGEAGTGFYAANSIADFVGSRDSLIAEQQEKLENMGLAGRMLMATYFLDKLYTERVAGEKYFYPLSAIVYLNNVHHAETRNPTGIVPVSDETGTVDLVLPPAYMIPIINRVGPQIKTSTFSWTDLNPKAISSQEWTGNVILLAKYHPRIGEYMLLHQDNDLVTDTAGIIDFVERTLNLKK